MRISVAMVAIVCLCGVFLATPAAHQHLAKDHDPQSLVHAHLDFHDHGWRSQSHSLEEHHAEIRYLDLFKARTVDSFALDVLQRREIALTKAGTVVSIIACAHEPKAHSPPQLDQLPPRSPPSAYTSA